MRPMCPSGSWQARADRSPLTIECEHVATCSVGGVPFQILRNMLLDDENVMADGTETVCSVRPGHFFDAIWEWGVHDCGL